MKKYLVLLVIAIAGYSFGNALWSAVFNESSEDNVPAVRMYYSAIAQKCNVPEAIQQYSSSRKGKVAQLKQKPMATLFTEISDLMNTSGIPSIDDTVRSASTDQGASVYDCIDMLGYADSYIKTLRPNDVYDPNTW